MFPQWGQNFQDPNFQNQQMYWQQYYGYAGGAPQSQAWAGAAGVQPPAAPVGTGAAQFGLPSNAAPPPPPTASQGDQFSATGAVKPQPPEPPSDQPPPPLPPEPPPPEDQVCIYI